MDKKKYTVMTEDNFHYTDEDYRLKVGEYDTLEEAVEVCKKIVESSVQYKEDSTPQEMYDSYCMFGEDPFIISDTGTGFNARDYARDYCERFYQQNQQQSEQKFSLIAYFKRLFSK